MSAGCIRSITQNARDGLFLRCGKETRGEFERAEKSDAPRFARSLRKRKFAKFAHALGLSVAHCETLESSFDRQQPLI